MRVASLIASLRERERVAARSKTHSTSSIINLLLHRQPLHERGECAFERNRTPRRAYSPWQDSAPHARAIGCNILYTLAKQSNLLSPPDRGEKTTNVYTGWVDILTGEVVLYILSYLPGFRHAFFSVLTFSSPQTKSINLSSSPFQDGGRHIYFGG